MAQTVFVSVLPLQGHAIGDSIGTLVRNETSPVPVVHLEKVCHKTQPICFDSIGALDRWIHYRRKPSRDHPLLVQIGPGVFSGLIGCFSYSDEPPTGWITFRGSGIDVTRVGLSPREAAGGRNYGCSGIGFEDLTIQGRTTSFHATDALPSRALGRSVKSRVRVTSTFHRVRFVSLNLEPNAGSNLRAWSGQILTSTCNDFEGMEFYFFNSEFEVAEGATSGGVAYADRNEVQSDSGCIEGWMFGGMIRSSGAAVDLRGAAFTMIGTAIDARGAFSTGSGSPVVIGSEAAAGDYIGARFLDSSKTSEIPIDESDCDDNRLFVASPGSRAGVGALENCSCPNGSTSNGSGSPPASGRSAKLGAGDQKVSSRSCGTIVRHSIVPRKSRIHSQSRKERN